MQIDSEAALRAYLERIGADLDAWCYPDHQTVEDLWIEVQRGESRLSDKPPRREVRVARISVVRGNEILIEEALEEPGRRRQKRGRIPSEKLMFDEDPAEGAARGLCEELGCSSAAIEIVEVTVGRTETRESSPTYPGLRTDYHFIEVSARVAGLPTGSFSTEEQLDGGRTVRHDWSWRSTAGPPDRES